LVISHQNSVCLLFVFCVVVEVVGLGFISQMALTNLQGGGEAVEGAGDDAARGADVEAHESGAFGAKHGAVVERQPGFLYEEVNELLLSEMQLAAVEPHEE
jgi:hypothetical protein